MLEQFVNDQADDWQCNKGVEALNIQYCNSTWAAMMCRVDSEQMVAGNQLEPTLLEEWKTF